MKRVKQQLFVQALMVLTLTAWSASLPAQVYKTVDENGHVTFTDQPPVDGSPPMTLPPISVIEAPTYETLPKKTAEGTDEPSVRELRRDYRDFAITAPDQEASIWNPEQPISVAWSTGKPLRKGMTVTLFMDGREQATLTEPAIEVAELERGEHTITAELKDAKRRKIATAQPVKFYIRRPGLNNRINNARNGGG